jgi:hypothetical protein
VLNHSRQTGHRSEFLVLGHKKSEIWLGLITDSIANLLSFSTLTHIDDFIKHNDDYSRSKAALVRSLVDRQKLVSSTV